ncbi:MAG: TaqI-like C-terminal specificity domain-containing protein [Deltaproteobacteria bacterium]|nr:TaqI-like C-terminal specificity domain-containing protein [Deltaproteobacteria bacterium]
MDWAEVKDRVTYKELPEEDSWVFMSNDERNLHVRLIASCERLDQVCKGITVGIQTSADHIYHLERLGPNRYLHKPKGKKGPVEIEIEDGIMHPLVSGPEAKRYQVPNTTTYILFPYEVKHGKVRLYPQPEMTGQYPNAWKHLKRYEEDLRRREGGKFDDDQWYRFGRHQNIDKQEISKLCVAQTVPGMRVAYDTEGAFYFNNVRVNGIIPTDMETGWFLLGVLNAPVCDFVFKRIAKPKEGGYYEANKQFIAPLPIPHATEAEKGEVAELSRQLQDLHTRRRDMMLMIDKRLSSAQCEEDKREEGWLWADVKPLQEIKKSGPSELRGKALNAWAKAERELRLAGHLEAITLMLQPGAKLTVEKNDGELRLLVNGTPVIEGVFLGDEEAGFIAAQWWQKARQTHVTAKFDGKRLINLLLKLRKTGNPAIIDQVVRLDADVEAIGNEIEEAEARMNQLTYRLYGLTDEEIRLVERVEIVFRSREIIDRYAIPAFRNGDQGIASNKPF